MSASENAALRQLVGEIKALDSREIDKCVGFERGMQMGKDRLLSRGSGCIITRLLPLWCLRGAQSFASPLLNPLRPQHAPAGYGSWSCRRSRRWSTWSAGSRSRGRTSPRSRADCGRRPRPLNRPTSSRQAWRSRWLSSPPIWPSSGRTRPPQRQSRQSRSRRRSRSRVPQWGSHLNKSTSSHRNSSRSSSNNHRCSSSHSSSSRSSSHSSGSSSSSHRHTSSSGRQLAGGTGCGSASRRRASRPPRAQRRLRQPQAPRPWRRRPSSSRSKISNVEIILCCRL